MMCNTHMQKSLYNLLLGLNRSIIRISKNNPYYPPKLNLDKNQDVDSLLVELNKVSLFLRAPEYSYMFKDKYVEYSEKNL